MCKAMQKVYSVTVTGGIGTACKSAAELRYARKEAQTALSYRVAIGSGQAIYLGDVEPKKTSVLQFQGSDETELMDAIKVGNEDEIERKVKSLFEKIRGQMLSNSQLEVYFIEVKIAFMRLLQYYEIETERFDEIDSLHVIDEIGSLNEAEKWLTQMSLEISQMIEETRKNSRSMITMRAKEFMLENYGDEELTVEKVSSILHVSPNYFSTLFKKEMQVSFISYLTEIRMKKAVEFLDMTDDKSYMIAEKVGYSDPNYFSHVFKKHFGVSPQKYRRRVDR